jgi:hypothetical protein
MFSLISTLNSPSKVSISLSKCSNNLSLIRRQTCSRSTIIFSFLINLIIGSLKYPFLSSIDFFPQQFNDSSSDLAPRCVS